MVKQKSLQPVGSSKPAVETFGTPVLQDILTEKYPSNMEELIKKLLFKFPASFNLEYSYQKVGYVIKVAYDIFSKTQPLPKNYKFEDDFNSILNVNPNALPKDENALVQYLIKKFKIQDEKDFKNLWLILSTLTDLIYSDKIQVFGMAKLIMEGRVGHGSINLTNAIISMTELVQRNTILDYEKRIASLQADVGALEDKVTELGKQQAQLESITRALEQAKSAYEELRHAAAEVTWEKKALSPSYITSQQLVDEIRKMANVLMKEKSMSFEEALCEVEFHNRALFIEKANEYVPQAFRLSKEKFSAVNALVALKDQQVTKVFDIDGPISYLFPKVLYPQNHDDVVCALRDQAQQLRDRSKLESENRRLRAENGELADKQRELGAQLEPMQQTYNTFEKRFQEYLNAATTVEWVPPSKNHPIWSMTYNFQSHSREEMYDALVAEYSIRMKVDKKVAYKILELHCGLLLERYTLSEEDIERITFPFYHEPKFTIDDLKQGLVPANAQPPQELTQEATPQEMIAKAMELLAQAKEKINATEGKQM